jgi:hypothetical protein
VNLVAAKADPAAVARLLQEARVDQTIAPMGWTDYLQAVIEALVDRLARYSSPLREFLSAHTGISRWLTYALLAVVVLVALLVVVEILRRRGRGAAPGAPGPRLASQPVSAARDAAAWRAEAERRLARGELGPALQALWWWFALSASGEVPESCTSRELVARVGRPELTAPARELDQLLYGPRRPQAEDVRAMVHRLEQVLS